MNDATLLEIVLVEAFFGLLQLRLRPNDIFFDRDGLLITLDRMLSMEQLRELEIRIVALGFLHRAGHHVSFFHFVEQKPILNVAGIQLQGGGFRLRALFGMKGLDAFQALSQQLDAIAEKVGARKREDVLPKIQEILTKVSRLDEEHAQLTAHLNQALGQKR